MQSMACVMINAAIQESACIGWVKNLEEEEWRYQHKQGPHGYHHHLENSSTNQTNKSTEQIIRADGELLGETTHCEKLLHQRKPSHSTAFIAQLKACTRNKDLRTGTRIHDDILKSGSLEECSDALVLMYAKCGVPVKAKELLDIHKSSNIATWNALIIGYAWRGQGQHALDCYEQIKRDGLCPNAVTFSCLLKACGSIRAAGKGEEIHGEIVRQGLLRGDLVLGNALIDMYVKCGALAKAQQVLQELPCRNVVSWSTLMAGYSQHGQGERALECFEQMKLDGLSPNSVTFTCILKACGSIGAADKGEAIHKMIAKQGLLRDDIVLSTTLVDMYVKFGALAKARKVLEELSSRDVVSWSALIAGYARHGQNEEALNCYERMQQEGIFPNAVTFACILKVCASLGASDKGQQIHDVIISQGLLANNVRLGTALVDMYSKCGALAKAQQVLNELPSRDVVSWGALIAGYVQHGKGEQALSCLQQMQDEGVLPDAVTLASILQACGSIKAADKGEKLHDEITRQGLLDTNNMLLSALVDMYAKCGALTKAQEVLEELHSSDVVSWNALITRYAQQGYGEQAVNCFERMQLKGLSPDMVTFASVLKACGSIGAADKGEQIHDQISRQGLLGDDVVLGNALVDMYAKCGALSKAHRVIEEFPVQDVVSWNALIAGYVQHGHGLQALSCFERLLREGLLPDYVTFCCVLNACSQLGLVEDGHMHFVNMSMKYGLKPGIEHYIPLVDLCGRAGCLDKAVGVIHEMPSLDEPAIWSALLGACQKWGDVNIGRWAFERTLQVDKANASAYILMANIYMAAGMQEEAEKIQARRLEI